MKDCQLRKARAYVSCIKSSASSLEPRDATGHSVHLICKRKRFLLESDAITRAFCQPPGLVGRGLAHPATLAIA